MALPWEPSFDSYEARMESARVLFYVDTAAAAHAPLASHPLRLLVRAAHSQAITAGPRDEGDSSALLQLEDVLATRLRAKLDAIYTGRLVADGLATFVFYLPRQSMKPASNLALLVGDVSPYRLKSTTEEDAAWAYYLQFMYPDLYAVQSILNRRAFAERALRGDHAVVAREVDHLALLPSEPAAVSAAASLGARGFRVEAPYPASEGDAGWWGLRFHRRDRVTPERADEFCAEILDLLLPLEGEYRGWEAVIARR